MFRRKHREPYVDDKHTYRADQLKWVHDGGSFDVIAVREVGKTGDLAKWNPKSGGY